MPIYEYACEGCGKDFEELIVRRADEAEVACPACRSRQVSRRMSRPAATRTGAASGAGGPPPRCGPVG
ncbi:FmdB family zinc ribbon protein [Anaeromyxobacter oryzae]|uniref:Putative regulatory protein FmdB zinc ribbon domain-containing protein n=1 Tax=Anaeromyxobacter oryzae TaxID=2918170 RepID=A0ABN6MZ05_9BACT|nr:zinc ribbon domain-containing protein [Anaeromyxobacter oryzae]BDG06192.1 hypothetical protein AMOR_51880 [Anaeromyxobacter oryzae]